MIKSVSLLELSFQIKSIWDTDTSVTRRFEGAGGGGSPSNGPVVTQSEVVALKLKLVSVPSAPLVLVSNAVVPEPVEKL